MIFICIGMFVSIGMLILFVVHFSTIMDIFTINKESLPQPEVTYGEFTVQIEYVVHGEPRVVEDVLVCEFVGFERKTWLEKVNTGIKNRRLWKSKLKNNSDGIVLFSDGKTIIDFSLGSADYYMGDIGINTHYPSFRVFENHSFGETICTHVFSADDLKEYGIEIINCELPKPIENSFKSISSTSQLGDGSGRREDRGRLASQSGDG